MADEPAGVVPMVAYRDGPAAMDWLAAAFGFREEARWLDDDGVLTHGDDGASHLDRSEGAGATLLS